MAGLYKRERCQTCKLGVWVVNQDSSTAVFCGRCKSGLAPIEAAECSICLEAIEDRVSFQTLSNHSWSNRRCSHIRNFCRECLRGHVAARLTDNVWNIRCPFVGKKDERCPYILMEPELKSVLNKPEDTWLLSQHEKLRMADHGDHLRAILSSQSKSDHDSGSTQPGSESASDSENSDFELWASNACQACPRCLVVVRKETGCDHMVCRCGTEFCFRCGGPYCDSIGPPCICNREQDLGQQLGSWLRFHGKLDDKNPAESAEWIFTERPV